MWLELEFFFLLLIRNSILLIVAHKRYLYSFLAIIDELHTLKIRVSKKEVIRGMHRTSRYPSFVINCLRLT